MAPAIWVGDAVTTFAGPGVVAAIKDNGMVTVTLEWKLAQGQGATAHFNVESVKAATPETDASAAKETTAAPATEAAVAPAALWVGDAVTTFAGPGVVAAIKDNGMVTVTLEWKLAQGQGATAHFNVESVKAATPETDASAAKETTAAPADGGCCTIA